MIVGSSHLARLVIDLVEAWKGCEVSGLVNCRLPAGTTLSRHKLLGSADEIPALLERERPDGCVVAIEDNQMREQTVSRILRLAPNMKFPSLVHQTVQIGKSAAIGCGTIIGPGTVVNADARVGRFCWFEGNSSLGHESVVADFVSIAQDVATGGNVKIGWGAAIGLGVIVVHGVSISERARISEGELVLEDVAGADDGFVVRPARRNRV